MLCCKGMQTAVRIFNVEMTSGQKLQLCVFCSKVHSERKICMWWHKVKIIYCFIYAACLWLLSWHLFLIYICLFLPCFHSSQNPTLGTATAVYRPSKMSPPSSCHYRSRRVGEVGCCYWLQERRTTCSLSSKTGKYRWMFNKLWRRLNYF